MTNENYQLYSSRSVGENFSQSFQLVQQHLSLMIRSILTVAGPFIAVGLIIEVINFEQAKQIYRVLLQAFASGNIANLSPETFAMMGSVEPELGILGSVLGFFSQIAIFIGSTFTYAAIYSVVRITSDSSYEGTKEEVLNYCNNIKWRLLGYYILLVIVFVIAMSVVFGIGMVVSALLLGAFGTVVTGLVAFLVTLFVVIRFALIMPVVAYEDVDFVGMLKRSWSLTGQHFGYVVTHGLIVIACGLLVGLIFLSLFWALPKLLLSILDTPVIPELLFVASYALGLFVNMYLISVVASMYGSIVAEQGDIDEEDEWLDD